ncbi:MAG: class I SAM-dependent methyltransferase [Halobacteriales archaeon]
MAALDSLLSDPWALLERAVDGPLHPGGEAATIDLLDRADVGEGTRLLDVGCGAGNALELAAGRGARPVGLDRNPPEWGAVRGDLAELPFGDASLDVVLGECVLCLSGDLDRTLAEIERVLVPGGRLALSDVTVEGEPPDLPPLLDEMFCLANAREPGGLRREVEAAGLGVTDVRTHREDLLSMRDRMVEAVDYERLLGLLGERGTRIEAGIEELEAAVEEGRVGYVSIVAERRR